LSLQEKELQALYMPLMMLQHVLNIFRQHAAEFCSTGDIEKLSEHSEIFADELMLIWQWLGNILLGHWVVSCTSVAPVKRMNSTGSIEHFI
jgi:hypothetical protein